MSELEACPLCGKKATLGQCCGNYWMSCKACGLILDRPGRTKQEVIDIWNSRVEKTDYKRPIFPLRPGD